MKIIKYDLSGNAVEMPWTERNLVTIEHRADNSWKRGREAFTKA